MDTEKGIELKMKILTAAEMAAVDARTVAAGTPIRELMQHAGLAVAQFCLAQYPDAGRVMVLCGKGNNGGDGFVAARALAAEGVGVRVLLAGTQSDVKGEAAEALAALLEATSEDVVEELTSDFGADDLEALLAEADLLLDAVVGTGFKPPLRGLAVTLRDAVGKVDVPVVAIDLPSGWDADSLDQTAPEAFRADAVVTFTAPKLAHVFGHLTAKVFGPVVVVEIGSSDELIVSASNLTWAGASKSLTESSRPINANKGMFGHVLVVGGSYGTAGAPSMASLACLRAGAGLVTAAVPSSILALVAAVAPELMLKPLAELDGTAALSNLDPTALEALLKGIKVIALGPGLSTRGEASEFARRLVAKTTQPIVIDADALNAFAGHTELLKAATAAGRTVVLTPHPGEMGRLSGLSVPEVEKDRVGLARRFATEHSVTLVLKGWRTLIAYPDGRIAVNTSGNPALAKGGSGDILTGIVAACLAQWPGDVAQAVEAAVYLHGLAGDFAAHAMDEKTVLALDTVAHLSDAFRYRATDPDGFVWLAGLRTKKEPIA